MAWRGWVILSVVMVGLTACGPRTIVAIDSEDPAGRLTAIRHAGEARDRTAVPKLVARLDDDDPVVRMMTIQALERITGTRMGYNPYETTLERQPAMQRWAASVRDGRGCARRRD